MGIESETDFNTLTSVPMSQKPSQPADFANRNFKRKLEVVVPPSSLQLAVFSDDSAKFRRVWKSQTTMRGNGSEEDGNSWKKLRLATDLQELRVLQIQRAMISDADGDRQIHVAVALEDLKIVKRLCPLMKKAGITLDITNFLRQTALHLAVIVGNADIVRVLLDHGASMVVRDRNGNSAVHLSVKYFEENVFRLLLDHLQSKDILDATDFEGYTALHHATMRSNGAAVNMLCSFGADMNAVDGKSGRTSLIHAVLAEDLKMTELLLESGACPDKTDYSGQSALDFALQTSNRALIKTLESRTGSFRLTSFKYNSACVANLQQKSVVVSKKGDFVSQSDSRTRSRKDGCTSRLKGSLRTNNRSSRR